MTVVDKNFNINKGFSVGNGKHHILDSAGRLTANYITLNTGGRYLSAGVDLWDLFSQTGIPPLSTNRWNETYENVQQHGDSWTDTYTFVESDSATNNTDYNRATYVNVSGDTVTGDLEIEGGQYLHSALRVDGQTYLSAAMFVENDAHVMGDLRVDGDVYLAVESVLPKTVYVGATDDDNIVFVADVSSNFIPDEDEEYDLGTDDKKWNQLFTHDISAADRLGVGGQIQAYDIITQERSTPTGNIKRAENIWYGKNTGSTNAQIAIETFETEHQAVHFRVVAKTTDTVTSLNTDAVHMNGVVDGTVYGRVTVGSAEIIHEINCTLNNNKYTIVVNVSPQTEVMITGEGVIIDGS